MSDTNSSQSARGVFDAEITRNEPLCSEHYLLTLLLRKFPPTAAGQFVQLQCTRGVSSETPQVIEVSEGNWPKITQPELVNAQPLLRRPLSLAGRRDTDRGVELDIIYRVIGDGTRLLAAEQVGGMLSVLGPLGNAFRISDTKPLAVLVGGGVGIPPMIYTAEALAAAGKQAVAICGVRTKDFLPLTLTETPSAEGEPAMCVEEFSRSGAAAMITSDDGSIGMKGFTCDALAKWLAVQSDASADVVVYTCGPEVMMHGAADICAAAGVECQVSMERYMGCGMGTCQSCVCKTKDPSDTEKGWQYKLCCTDGPVFDAAELIWD